MADESIGFAADNEIDEIDRVNMGGGIRQQTMEGERRISGLWWGKKWRGWEKRRAPMRFLAARRREVTMGI